MQKTGEVSLYKTNFLGAGRRYGLFALLFICAIVVSFGIFVSSPMQAYASDLTWNTSEGLGNLNGKTVGSGKMFSGEHNNSSYPDNFKIEFKYYDSEGNIKTWDGTCNLRNGKNYSIKIDIPVEFSDFKHWQVIGTGNQLSGESPSVGVVLMPVGKAGPVTFKTVSAPSVKSEAKGATDKLLMNRTSSLMTSGNSLLNGSNSSGNYENSESEEDGDYLNPLREELSKAVALGKKATIYWSAGTALPRDIMLTLHDNPDLTLVFSYRYEHKNYVVTILGKNVVIEENVPWYGPLNLYGRYGGVRK